LAKQLSSALKRPATFLKELPMNLPQTTTFRDVAAKLRYEPRAFMLR
jgi:hypothetical protein